MTNEDEPIKIDFPSENEFPVRVTAKEAMPETPEEREQRLRAEADRAAKAAQAQKEAIDAAVQQHAKDHPFGDQHQTMSPADPSSGPGPARGGFEPPEMPEVPDPNQFDIVNAPIAD